MNRKEFLEKHGLKPKSYSIKNKVHVIDTETGRFVIKPCDRKKKEIYDYLESRNFMHFPKVYNDLEDGYEICECIDDIVVPREQRAEDMIYLMSMLHNKTTFYKEFSLDDSKSLYEELGQQIFYLQHYYHDLQDMIENEIYMSPGNYLLIRNISNVYQLLFMAQNTLEKWYTIMKEKKRARYAMTHNSMDLSHLLENQSIYMVSWDQAKINLPVYDLYDFYKRNYKEVEFKHLLEIYQSKYKLLEEEELLLSVLISIPDKLILEHDEFFKTRKIYQFVHYVNQTVSLFQQPILEPTRR